MPIALGLRRGGQSSDVDRISLHADHLAELAQNLPVSESMTHYSASLLSARSTRREDHRLQNQAERQLTRESGGNGFDTEPENHKSQSKDLSDDEYYPENYPESGERLILRLCGVIEKETGIRNREFGTGKMAT